MATKGKTKNGKTKMTDAELDAYIEKNNTLTDAKRAELEAFAALYPPAVVSYLHDGLIKHISEVLESAGHKEDADLLGNEIFTLKWYEQAFRDGQIEPKVAGELMGFTNTDGLLEDVAKATRIMAENGMLMTDL